MAKKYEDARAAGLTTSFSADEAVGIAVQSALFQRRLKVKDLAETLGVVSSVASRKIRGEVTWSITDIMRTADLLGVEAATLLPRKAENPGQLVLAGVPVVAGTGFEPVTSGSGVATPGSRWLWDGDYSLDGGWIQDALEPLDGNLVQPKVRTSCMGGVLRPVAREFAYSGAAGRNRQDA